MMKMCAKIIDAVEHLGTYVAKLEYSYQSAIYLKVRMNNMIIEKRWLAKFKDVKPGEAFDYDGCIYIKAECTAMLLKDIDGEVSINAIGLNYGSYTKFEDDDKVTIYENAKVVLI